MTAQRGHLRDARLKKALDSAPDAAEVSAEWARVAIKNAALWSLQKPQPVPWWRRWRGGRAGARMPWNAAFATVLLAGFVTVFWHGHEVPDAQPDSAAQTPSGGHAASASPPVPAVAKAEAPAEPASVAGARSATQPHQDRRVERERAADAARARDCLLYTSPSPRD